MSVANFVCRHPRTSMHHLSEYPALTNFVHQGWVCQTVVVWQTRNNLYMREYIATQLDRLAILIIFNTNYHLLIKNYGRIYYYCNNDEAARGYINVI